MASSNVIEVFIETLHGTAFELLVSPADTVVSIKTRISRLEGIPVSQQHLIWQCQELPDESSLHDCNITDGATLKLVLGMRGGPINTRKASAEERPSLFDVAKYLDAKQEELGLNAPRLRAVRMVVMRDGDQVHLYTLVDGGSRSSTGSLSSAHSTREMSDEDSASESRRHRENLVTRHKVELLQQKLRSCRLRKVGKVSYLSPSLCVGSAHSTREMSDEDSASESRRHRENLVTRHKVELLQQKLRSCRLRKEGRAESPEKPEPEKSIVPAPEPVSESEPLLDTGPVLPDPQLKEEPELEFRPEPLAAGDAARGEVRELLPSLESVPTTRRQLWREPCGNCWIDPEPETVLPHRPSAGATSRILSGEKVGRTLPQLLVSPSSGTSQKEASRLWRHRQGSAAQVSFPRGSDAETRGAVGGALPKRLPEPGTTKMATRGAAGRAFRGRCRKVLIVTTSVGPSSPQCKGDGAEDGSGIDVGRFYKVLPPLGRQGPKEREAPEGDLAPLLEPPLQLDAWDCQRPQTAPARYRTALRPLLRTFLSRESGRQAQTPGRGPGNRPEGYALHRRLARVVAERSSPGLAQRRQPPSPALGPRTGAEGIRWALAGGRTSSSSRLAVIPLFRKVHGELLQASNELRRNLSRLGRLAADHEGEESRIPAEPKSNGPSENSPERQSTSAGPSAGAKSSAPAPQVVSSAVDECPKENSETGESSQESSQSQLPPLKGKKKLAKRCSWCNRKTGLASTYVCRCGKNFCAAHRYAELHHCSHDYKTEGRHILQRNNPVVKASKLPKI
ncbi:hypothetical protein IscW_ISCW008021 [Ixodes scapularis]|uniref:Uncharacterized protein n=1 Tax=Ixodes scapularis TaxID=6945 RepID=B7PWD2_IXOSC|nr:hypothetical protein IscW_ISCW008021 [Ixodes scapularis]|eukprot:XP_002409683.1 hypothetical protein IscW_ISCW008021 [Ixodes scapularis]